MHMTQEELAETMCIPKSTISAYENDKVDVKSSVIMELAHILFTTPDYLLGYDDSSAEDRLIKSVSSILSKIEDEKVRSLLFAQIRVAAELYT